MTHPDDGDAFVATTHQNEFLPIGGSDVDAIVSVRARAPAGTPLAHDDGAAAVGTAVVVIIDVSGSMNTPRSKLKEARRAAIAAIAALDDGVLFGVVAGSHEAQLVYPHGPALVPANGATRTEAEAAIGMLTARGGTSMSTWLMAARNLLAPYEGLIRQAILLTDGHNESETRAVLDDAIRRCAGVVQCDCRGVGTQWSVEELRAIATGLLGTVDIVARPDEMAADFEAIVRRTMGRHVADVALRVWTPRGASLRFVRQVAPTIDDLLARGQQVDDRTVRLPTGAWGVEEREYHVGITVPPQDVGAEMLAARVSVVRGDDVVAQTLVRAVWSDDPATCTIIEPRVAHYTGQHELAAAIRDGLAARSMGDDVTATRKLGRAAQLADAAGHQDTLQLLARVVDVEDAPTGTVRLKRVVAAEDEMALDARSTATVRVRAAE